MTTRFKIIDLRSSTVAEEVFVDGAKSPEDAVRRVLGFEPVRSGAKKDLAARVYWQLPGQPMNMVRLYNKVDDEDGRVQRR
jgi:hypothetical protein